MARKPATQSTPVTGSVRSTPRTSAVDFVLIDGQDVAGHEEQHGLGQRMVDGVEHASRRPATPPRPTPRARMPMCSTLE